MSEQATLVTAGRRKLRKGAKYDYNFVEVAARMVAAGMTVAEVGFWLGVKPTTIKQWKARYPEFKAATDNKSDAKAIAHAHLVASGLRSAMGYDYEEVDVVTEEILNDMYDPEDPDSPRTVMVEKKRTTKLRHSKPDKDLLQFFLINLGNEYKNHKSVSIETTKKEVNVNLTGQLEASDIRKLAGAACKVADGKDNARKRLEVITVDAVGSDSDDSKTSTPMDVIEASVSETTTTNVVSTDDDFIASLTDDE